MQNVGTMLVKNWTILKNLLPSKKKESASFKIQSNEGYVTDHKKIAEILNKTFNDVCDILSQELPTLINSVDSMHTLNATENEFKFSEISEEFVCICICIDLFSV